MTDRQKLMELICESMQSDKCITHCNHPHCNMVQSLCEHLIANGVTIPVRCNECRYYNEDGEYCGMWCECRHPEHYCDEGVQENAET